MGSFKFNISSEVRIFLHFLLLLLNFFLSGPLTLFISDTVTCFHHTSLQMNKTKNGNYVPGNLHSEVSVSRLAVVMHFMKACILQSAYELSKNMHHTRYFISICNYEEKRGREEGRKQGRKEARKQGRKQARKERKTEKGKKERQKDRKKERKEGRSFTG